MIPALEEKSPKHRAWQCGHLGGLRGAGCSPLALTFNALNHKHAWSQNEINSAISAFILFYYFNLFIFFTPVLARRSAGQVQEKPRCHRVPPGSPRCSWLLPGSPTCRLSTKRQPPPGHLPARTHAEPSWQRAQVFPPAKRRRSPSRGPQG